MAAIQKKSFFGAGFWSVVFVLNFIGMIALLFILELDEQLAVVTKVISAVWSAAAFLLGLLGWKKEESRLSLPEVLVRLPMKILNTVVFVSLIATFYIKFFYTTPVSIKIQNEYGEEVLEGISINGISGATQHLPNGEYAVFFANSLYEEENTTLGKIYVPLLRNAPITKTYRCHLKKGALKFNLHQQHTRLEVYPVEIKASVKDLKSHSYEPYETEFVIENLLEGKYGYRASNEWAETTSDTVEVKFPDTTLIELDLKPKESGIRIKVDYRKGNIKPDNLQRKLRYFWDRSYLEQYSGQTLEFFIPLQDYQQHLIEIKYYDENLYYGNLVGLTRPGTITLECPLEIYPISIVDFYGPKHPDAAVYIDGENRGSLDHLEYTISLPVFDGFRNVKVGNWEQMIRFPTLDNYVEIP